MEMTKWEVVVVVACLVGCVIADLAGWSAVNLALAVVILIAYGYAWVSQRRTQRP
jgi:hypothetical protein